MARLQIPTRDDAPTAAQPILDGVKKQLGFVPNLFRLISNSPAALNGYMGLQTALTHTLDVKTRDAIALAVSQVNGCEYCLVAHSYTAANFAKLSPEEIAAVRQGRSSDPKRAAAVHFAQAVTEKRGRVSDEELAAVRAAGFADSQIVEIVMMITQMTATNLLNNIARTEIDFPTK